MTKQAECHYCNIGRERKLDPVGAYYHVYKESNGQGWDTYLALCSEQTKSGMEVLRARVLSELDRELAKAKKKAAKLKAEIKQVRKTKDVGPFRSFWE